MRELFLLFDISIHMAAYPWLYLLSTQKIVPTLNSSKSQKSVHEWFPIFPSLCLQLTSNPQPQYPLLSCPNMDVSRLLSICIFVSPFHSPSLQSPRDVILLYTSSLHLPQHCFIHKSQTSKHLNTLKYFQPTPPHTCNFPIPHILLQKQPISFFLEWFTGLSPFS